MSTTPSVTRAHPLADRAQLFQAFSDETRLSVLEMLRGGERCVCELQDALDAAQSRLSFHLRVLREAGLVQDRKEGRWSYYALNPEGLEAASKAAAAFLSPPRRPGCITLECEWAGRCPDHELFLSNISTFFDEGACDECPDLARIIG
jgi:ArsR family transcriptional regulator